MSEVINKMETYTNDELAIIKSIIYKLGFIIDEYQPHISGERNLMRAVTTKSGKKFILLGNRIEGGERVVIKVTKDSMGIEEIKRERICRDELKNIPFAYQIFSTPEELLFEKVDNYIISVQKYIEQKSTFLNRPIEDQFNIALRSFKAQEGAHAVTHKHKKLISETFGFVNSDWYLSSYKRFQKNISLCLPEKSNLQTLLDKGYDFLHVNKNTIEQYCNFLTHTDFVPHNFRVTNENIYLLDVSSLRFGNKYEGLARFLNYMTLYNRELEEAFLFYIKNNRTKEEYLSLQLMRVYRLGEIIWYYTNLLEKTSGNLNLLTNARIDFWASVLEAVLNGAYVSEDIVNEYKKTRNRLRDDDERKRQELLR